MANGIGLLIAEPTITVHCDKETFFIRHHAGPTPSPSKKLDTEQECQSADYHGEHAHS